MSSGYVFLSPYAPLWCVCVRTYRRGLRCCLFGTMGNSRASLSGTATVQVPLFLYTMTNKQEILRTLNFAEANVENKDANRLFRDYAERCFLVGYIRSNRRKWIKENKLYPIRPESANRRGGIDINNPQSFAVDYVVLYDNSKSNRYKVYKAESSKLYSAEDMEVLGYEKPRSEYLVFSLGDEVKFESIDLSLILKRENAQELFRPIYLSGYDIFSCYRKDSRKKIGLVDADLLCNGTRHPNLALLKIAGYLYDNNVSFELIIDSNADISQYEHIYMSRVFTFTEEPAFYTNASPTEKKKFHIGGTGYYANEKSVSKFRELREKDMEQLSHDSYLNTLVCKHDGTKGIKMAIQMPYYDLYKEYIDKQVAAGFKRDKYKDYEHYSIGFLTRRCFRHCPFCVNKLEDGVVSYSKLEWFHDKKRPHVYFWDDNFLGAPYHIWKAQLQYLIDNKISFQFRQGLDERLLAEDEHGEEMAQMLSKTRYHGDFIFAFDNWKDRDIIERALKIWKRHNPKKGTKFYLFCGFMQTQDNFDKFYRDIWELFQRIKILMQYGCVGYVMRHEDYHKSPLENIYVQIARWCNQQAFYKKMSFWEYSYRNQTFWEEQVGFEVPHKLKTFADFEHDLHAGYYEKEDTRGKVRKICRPLQTVLDLLEMFPQHRKELLEMFDYKMIELKDPSLWE